MTNSVPVFYSLRPTVQIPQQTNTFKHSHVAVNPGHQNRYHISYRLITLSRCDECLIYYYATGFHKCGNEDLSETSLVKMSCSESSSNSKAGLFSGNLFHIVSLSLSKQIFISTEYGIITKPRTNTWESDLYIETDLCCGTDTLAKLAHRLLLSISKASSIKEVDTGDNV